MEIEIKIRRYELKACKPEWHKCNFNDIVVILSYISDLQLKNVKVSYLSSKEISKVIFCDILVWYE